VDVGRRCRKRHSSLIFDKDAPFTWQHPTERRLIGMGSDRSVLSALLVAVATGMVAINRSGLAALKAPTLLSPPPVWYVAPVLVWMIGQSVPSSVALT